jgi:hypothetical protein
VSSELGQQPTSGHDHQQNFPLPAAVSSSRWAQLECYSDAAVMIIMFQQQTSAEPTQYMTTKSMDSTALSVPGRVHLVRSTTDNRAAVRACCWYYPI